MVGVSEQRILDCLKRVIDPERNADVVSLGMITGLVVKGGNVGFAVEVDPAEGERKEPLRRACETAVEALPGITSVTAVLTAHRGAGGGNGQAPRQAAAPQEIGRAHV